MNLTLNEELARYVESLARYIVEDRCALFVGPDLAESAGGYRGLPTSWQMANELAKRCDYQGRLPPLPQMAQIFESKLDRHTLVEYLRERLASPEYRPLPIHELIARIPFSVIIHGGWDTLLEQALRKQGIPFSIVGTDIDIPYSPQQQLVLYKPYGTIDRLSSLMVTEDDQLKTPYQVKGIVNAVEYLMRRRALLLIGYAPNQDRTFVRLYHEIRQFYGHTSPAFAVQSLRYADDATAWEAREVTAIIAEPTTFLRQLAEAVAQRQGREFILPDPLSEAPRLTPTELVEQAELFNNILDQVGIADLVEQTNIPLLSSEQLRDIEVMGAAYERLAGSFDLTQSSARVWLRRGNLEYVRENYDRATAYYQRAISVEPHLGEAYHNLHYTRLAQGDWSGALAAYQQAIHQEPELAILPERYQIQAILGSGGVSVVYQAWDAQEQQVVAVKVLQRSRAQTEQILRTFEREAHILQRLSHPHIVRILDFRSYVGNYFIVMEYLAGQSLKAALAARSEPFSLDEAFHLTRQVGEALAHAHLAGVVHRDVKPSNVFLVDGKARLIDFGLARPMMPGEQSMLGAVSGTVTYLAPEQALGLPADQRTDIYGLATLFYEMLTKRNPGQGAFRPLSELRSDLNNALDLVIEKARARDPGNRPSTMTDFLEELQRVVVLQPASEDALLRVRLVARIAQGTKVTIERYWWVWLAAILSLGFVLPALWQWGSAVRAAGRYAATSLMIIFLAGIVARYFTMGIVRWVRSPAIAAYGPALVFMGLILGAANSFFWLSSYSFMFVPEQSLGNALLIDYFLVILATLIPSLAVAVVTFLLLLTAGTLAQRSGRNYALGFFGLYFLLTGILLALGIILPFGWLGDLSPAPINQLVPPGS